jgi:hypothetical protein
VAALRFFYVKTLKRHHMLEHLPFPGLPEKLPTVLSRDEVSRLLAASANRKSCGASSVGGGLAVAGQRTIGLPEISSLYCSPEQARELPSAWG